MISTKSQEILLSELISNVVKVEKKDKTTNNTCEWMMQIIDEIKNEEENLKKISDINTIVDGFNDHMSKKYKWDFYDFLAIGLGLQCTGCVVTSILSVYFLSDDAAQLLFFGSFMCLILSFIGFFIYNVKQEEELKNINKILYVKNECISIVAYGYLKYKTSDAVCNKELLETLFYRFGSDKLDTSYANLKEIEVKIKTLYYEIKAKHNKEKNTQFISDFMKNNVEKGVLNDIVKT